GDAEFGGDEAGPAQPAHPQGGKTDVLSQDFLQLLLDLIAILMRQNIKSLHQPDRREQKHDGQPDKNLLRAFNRTDEGGAKTALWKSVRTPPRRLGRGTVPR